MKKTLTPIVLLCLGLILLSGCGKKTMPVPEYPLSSDKIEEEFKAWESAWREDYTIEEDDMPDDTEITRSFYHLYCSVEDEYLVYVLSSEKDDERALAVSFPPYFSDKLIPVSDCEDAINFVSRLFGGFERENQLFDSFSHDYYDVNTTTEEYEISIYSKGPERERMSTWESEINGISCRIIVEQYTEGELPKYESQEYISQIMLISDWDTFYGE